MLTADLRNPIVVRKAGTGSPLQTICVPTLCFPMGISSMFYTDVVWLIRLLCSLFRLCDGRAAHLLEEGLGDDTWFPPVQLEHLTSYDWTAREHRPASKETSILSVQDGNAAAHSQL